LTRDCALVKTKQQRNLRLVVSFFDQYVYLVSLFAGKLSVAHRCASLTWRLKSTLTLQQLAFSPLSQSCTSNLKPPFDISHLLFGLRTSVRLKRRVRLKMIKDK